MTEVFSRRRSSLLITKSRENSFEALPTPPPTCGGSAHPGKVPSAAGTLSLRDGFEQQDSGTDAVSEREASEAQKVLKDLCGVRDLATLAKLDEEAIVRELEKRYQADTIYTYVGDILIALNPFRQLPHLYSDDASKFFYHDKDPCMVPHVFSVAQKSYKSLLHAHKNQCCVISGESGAGKTETAKFLVWQLLAMCKGTGTLEERIIQVNPLLEAFGNAKTCMNDNSSRFGKFLELKFGFFGEVLGAKIAEYLLEKSRVVRQGTGERNFHVFYYLFAGISDDERTKYKLKDITDYHYLRGGSKGLTQEAVIDVDNRPLKDQYVQLLQCLENVGFTAEEISSLMYSLALVLQLGNLEFEETEQDTACINVTNPQLIIVAEMIGCEAAELQFALQSYTHRTRGEELQFDYKLDQAEDNRDALAKGIYGRLFSWIVFKINELLGPKGSRYEDACKVEGGVTEVGILDIFGFENFVQNSFEQFCINIANEQLQFYFNQHIFAWELAVYEEEGLDVGVISYKDNGPLLNMVLGKPLGMFALLDEESRFPKASAQSLATKFSSASEQNGWASYKELESKQVRKMTVNMRKLQKAAKAHDKGAGFGPFFTISHYAGDVIYDADGFLEKNRDTLSGNVVKIMKQCENSLVSTLFTASMTRHGSIRSTTNSKKSRRGSMDKNKQSVSAVFKESLLDLMRKMQLAVPHFIRCIKPNQEKQPRTFDNEAFVRQLRYTGVLETTRIRRDGYSLRLKLYEFAETYKVLAFQMSTTPKFDEDTDEVTTREAARKIIKRAGLKGAQLGLTMVFLKYYHNEKLMRLMEMQHKYATKIETCVRAYVAKCRLQHLKEEVIRKEQERKEQEERERRERELAEKLAAEKAAAEALAAEAARLEKERLAEEERLRQATITRRKQVEERARKQELVRLEAVRKAEEAARKAKKAEEQMRIEHERQAQLEQEKQEKLAAEERQKEAERQAKFAKEQAEFEAAKKLQRRDSITSVLKLDDETGCMAEDSDDDSDMEDDDFLSLLAGDGSDLDDEERHLLRLARAKREREEQIRKAKLADEHRKEKEEEERLHMLELQRIAERAREEREERERQAVVDAAEVEARVAELSFSFSWGSPVESTPTPTPAPAPAPVAAEPAAAGADGKKPARMTSMFRSKKKKAERKSSKDASLRGKKPPPTSPKPSKKRFSSFSRQPAVPEAPAEVESLPLPPSQTGTLKKKKVRPPPPEPPVELDSDEGSGTVKGARKVGPPTPIPEELSGSDSGTVKAKKEAPTPIIPVELTSDSTGTIKAKKKKPPPPVLPKPKTPEPPTQAVEALSVPTKAAPAEALVVPAKKPTPPPAPASAPAPPATGATPATTAAATPAADSGEKKPRRRKLVRGGNAIVTPVLPEYTAALKALDDLDVFLDDFLATEEAAEQPAAADGALPPGAQSPLLGATRRRRSTHTRQARAAKLKSHPSQSDALSDLLLIGEASLPPPSPNSSPAKVPALTQTRFLNGVSKATTLKHSTSRASALVGDGKLTPADLLRIDEKQRLELLTLVKEGELTPEEAMAEIMETKQRQNCVVG